MSMFLTLLMIAEFTLYLITRSMAERARCEVRK